MDRLPLDMVEAAVLVGSIVGLGVRLIQFVAERIGGRRVLRRVGRPAAMAWALGCALAAFAAAAILSIGFLVLPVAMIVCGVAAWRYRALPEGAVGAGLGSSIAVAIIGLMNPPPPNPLPPACLGQPFTVPAGQHSHVSCGGMSLSSWLPLAIGLVVFSVAGQVLVERRKKAQAHSQTAA
jgi:hypothetical protein